MPELVVETSRPRPGRRFEPTHELSLTGAALRACDALPGAQRGLLVVREMAGPLGIPDFTAVVGDLDALKLRLSLDVPPLLNEVDAAIVALAHESIARSTQWIAAKVGWPADVIRRRVPGLIKVGAVMSSDGEKIKRHYALKPFARVYAVEAKVSDRIAVMRQARTYRAWADGCVIVMGPLSGSALEAVREQVENDRIGLMVDGRWYRRPNVQAHRPWRRMWTAEHVVAAMSGQVASLPSFGCPVEAQASV